MGDVNIDDDLSAVRSLAERLLVQITGTEVRPPDRARLIVGTLPDDFPVNLPIPAGATVVGSVVAPTPWAGEGRVETRVILESSMDADAGVPAVVELATGLGWSRLERPEYPAMGGFAPWPDVSRHLTLCHGRRGPALDVSAAPRQGGGSELRMTLRDDDGLCGDHHGMPPKAGILPTLHAPAGVRLRGEGGGGRIVDIDRRRRR